MPPKCPKDAFFLLTFAKVVDEMVFCCGLNMNFGGLPMYLLAIVFLPLWNIFSKNVRNTCLQKTRTKVEISRILLLPLKSSKKEEVWVRARAREEKHLWITLKTFKNQKHPMKLWQTSESLKVLWSFQKTSNSHVV